jgi:RimJ/RimL family protein N-acetyltransferase
MLTPRLEVRLPVEGDRRRFLQLFCDDDFMAFTAGMLDVEAANHRFDEMLLRGEELSFAKQPVIELATGVIIGYSGADWFEFEGLNRLEFGYRLIPEARGRGFATEASRAVLAKSAEIFRGDMLAIIDPKNHASVNVARKLGFLFWKPTTIDNGYPVNIFRLHIS